jgi:hypothetical protein
MTEIVFFLLGLRPINRDHPNFANNTHNGGTFVSKSRSKARFEYFVNVAIQKGIKFSWPKSF